MGKAPDGDGYPRQNKKTGTWVQWLDFGRDAAGKRIRKKVTGQSRDDVKQKARKLRAQHTAGVDVRAKVRTVADLMADYLASGDWRPRTLASYTYIANRFILPTLGTMDVTKVQPRDIRQLLTKLKTEQGKSRGRRVDADGAPRTIKRSTIGLVRTVLNQLFELAIDDKLIAHNPVSRVKAPKRDESPQQALNDEQAAALLNALQGDRLALAVRLLLSLGLRRGECAALRLDDLDLEANTLRIDATLGYVPGIGNHYGPAKSKRGMRTIPLAGDLPAALAWHLRQRELEQKAMGWDDSPWLFRSIKTGGKLNSESIYTAFTRAAKKANLVGFTPHSLRHSCVTFLMAERVPHHIIMAIVGHGNLAQTLHYTHELPGERTEAMQKLADRLNRTPDRKASGE